MEHAKLAFWFGMAAIILQIIGVICIGVEYFLPADSLLDLILVVINFLKIFMFLSLLFSILPLVVVCPLGKPLSHKARIGVRMGIICYSIAILEMASIPYIAKWIYI